MWNSELADELLNSTSYDIDPMKTFDTRAGMKLA